MDGAEQAPGGGVMRNAKAFTANKQAECDYLFSALPRLELQDYSSEICGDTAADGMVVYPFSPLFRDDDWYV